MMKKLLVLMLVLGMASMASAMLQISVGGVVDPPESAISIFPSDYVTIDVTGDGADVWAAPFLFVQGPGRISGGVVVYPGSATSYKDLAAFAASQDPPVTEAQALLDAGNASGVLNLVDLSFMEIIDLVVPPAPLLGKLVDGIMFHCEGAGDVTLTLWDMGNMVAYDTQIIHQIIPEPITIALLGLGGLFLRRRK